MKNKRSAIEMQFNWIFVLVIGAVILIVFFGFTARQRDVSQELSRSSTVNAIDAIVTSAQSSAGQVGIVNVPKEEVKIECNRISLGSASRQYENLVLFSPSEIKSSKLITHTASLSIPYRVANLLFVTSPDVRYIIIGDFHLNDDSGRFARLVNESIPKEVNKDTFYYNYPTKAGNVRTDVDDKKYTEITYKGDAKVRLVVTGIDNFPSAVPLVFQYMPNGAVTKVIIIRDKDKGIINFFENKNKEWSPSAAEPQKISNYIKESLIGAIYSDDLEQYKCSMNNVLSRLKKVTSIYNKRVEKLHSDSQTTPSLSQCKDMYSASQSQNWFGKIGISDFSAGGISNIIDAGNRLNGINKELQEKSCPLIY